MRRTLLVLTVPIVMAVGLLSATSAAAETVTVSGGQLTAGTAVTANIQLDEREVEYTFSGKVNEHFTFDATASNWGSGAAQLRVSEPDGGPAQLFCPLGTGPTNCDLILNSTGEWSVKVQPLDNAKGNVTFKLVADQNRGTLVAGTPSTATVDIKNQRAYYSFAGTQGVKSGIDVSNSVWSNGADLQIVEPGGVVGLICPIEEGTSFCAFTPPSGGTWKAVIAPYPDSVGHSTLSLAAEVNKGTLAPNTPTLVEIKARATSASYSFAATANVRHLIAVKETNWGGGSAELNLYSDDGVHQVSCPIDSVTAVCEFKPKNTATWKAKIEPVENAIGKATLTLVSDKDRGALAPGVATSAAVSVPGDHATYTFPAVTEEQRINVTGSSWTSGAELQIINASGIVALVCPLTTATSACDFRPNTTGTWKASIVPDADGTGSASLTLVADKKLGSLTLGTAVTPQITTAGTTASYTFTATKDVLHVFDVTASDWKVGATAGGATMRIYLPGNVLGLTCDLKTVALQCPFIPRVAGSWRVVIDPVNGALGKTTFTLGANSVGPAVTPGTEVTTKVTSRSIQTSYPFTVTAKMHTTFDVTASDWGTGAAELQVLQTNGTQVVVCKLAKVPTFCDFTPTVSGTWKVAVVPLSGALGSVKFKLATDQSKGPLAANTPSTAAIGTRGQRAFWTFTASAGKQSTILVSAASWGTGGSAVLSIYPPTGPRVLACPITAATATCKFTTSVGGTWKAELGPNGTALGQATLTLSPPK